MVNGITGQPFKKAFVIERFNSSNGRNSLMLTDIEWQQLNAIDKPVLCISKEFYETWKAAESGNFFRQIVPTDANGWFEIVPSTICDSCKLIVFAKNYLTVTINNDDFELEADNRVKIQQVKMFRAAKIRLQTWAEGSYNRSRPTVWPECVIDKQNNPSWVDDFLNGVDAIGIGSRIRLNKQACFPVPAGLNFTLQLRYIYNDVEKTWASLTVARNVNLEQGQVLDLGRHQILRPVPLFISVFNSSEQAVEGVPVNARDQYGQQTSSTDENGVALFELAPDAKGQFIVEYDGDNDSSIDDLREEVPYEITGPEDANTIYTLRVSDKLLYNLFK